MNEGEMERRAAFFRALRTQGQGTQLDKRLTELATECETAPTVTASNVQPDGCTTDDR